MGPARQFARLSSPLSATMSVAASRAGLGVPKVSAGLTMGQPQGVDLNLDQFNLSAASAAGDRYGGAIQAKDVEANVGSIFWQGLSEGDAFGAEHAALLKHVFNPHMSDRRSEGEAFMPPPTSPVYLQKLKELVKAEQVVLRQRRAHFFSEAFQVDSAGPLFPPSWTSSMQLDLPAHCLAKLPSPKARPDFLAQADVLRPKLAAAKPSFDRVAEDGARFRAYRVGALEVRTIQEAGGKEAIGMVFDVATPEM